LKNKKPDFHSRSVGGASFKFQSVFEHFLKAPRVATANFHIIDFMAREEFRRLARLSLWGLKAMPFFLC
jgi:hypothetical protein